MKNDTITIKEFRKGWFDFEIIPQEHRYIKINALNCVTKRKALNTAKKINPNFKYIIEVLE